MALRQVFTRRTTTTPLADAVPPTLHLFFSYARSACSSEIVLMVLGGKAEVAD
jgi:hypothetical protein